MIKPGSIPGDTKTVHITEDVKENCAYEYVKLP
jgi:hypothetical protein